MRFKIKKENFLEKLEIINKIIPSQTINNIFLFVQIILNEKTLKLIGSSDETSICIFIRDKSIYDCKNGSILIRAKQLLEIIRKMNSEYFTLEVLESEKIIEISDISSDEKKKSSFKLKCISEETKYPEINFTSYKKKVILSTNDFIKSTYKTYFAASASNKNNYPILNAININFNNETILFTSSDSFRCARVKNKLIGIKNINFNINIPVKTMLEISNIFKKNTNIEISTDDLKVVFNSKDIIISSNLLKGDFPNIKIFDDFNKNEKDIFSLKIKAKLLLESLERILVLSNEEKIVKLTILNNNEIKLFSEDNNIGNATEIINDFSSNNHNNFEICFNGKYVIDAIKALNNEDLMNNEENKSDEIEFQFMSKNRPFIIKNTNNDNVIQVIAPISE